MRQNVFYPPDAAALERILQRERTSATGVILRLAWQTGLTREEIASLTWDGVDLAAGELRLPDRTVPLMPDTAACLTRWRSIVEDCGPCVVVSERRRARLTPQSISRLARTALDAEGRSKVRLLDLRYDFVLRQLKTHDWRYVLRISGISVTTYRNCLAPAHKSGASAAPETRDAKEEEYNLWRLMQSEQDTPAGIALWLSHRIGLSAEEIVSLTWAQVDFAAPAVRLPGRDEPLSNAVTRILRAEYERRAPDDDPHVILTPRTRKPVTAARLSTMVRTILIRGGVETRSLRDLRRDGALEEKRGLLDYAAKHGSVSRAETMALLKLNAGVAYSRLNALVSAGELVRVNFRYYPAGTVVPPERQTETVRAYLAENGSAYCSDLAALLHIGKRQTARLLHRMVERGELTLLRREKRYRLNDTDNG